MPRPKLPRYIQSRPDIQGFTPDGIAHTEETILSMEEFEAIRLIDYLGLDQAGAAEQMNVSRQTFGRILKQARYNLSDALVNGKRLIVTGGCYEMQGRGRGRRRQGRTFIQAGEDAMTQNQTIDNNGQGQGRGLGQGRGRGKGRGQGQGQGQGRGKAQGRGQGNGGGRRGNR